MEGQLLVLVIPALVALFALVGRWRLAFPGPWGLPLLGCALTLDTPRLHLQMEEWRRRYGDAFLISILGKPMVVLSSQDDVNLALKERPGVFRRIHTFAPLMKELAADGVFSAEGSDWKRMRKATHRAFTPAMVRDALPVLAGTTLKLERKWLRAVENGNGSVVLNPFVDLNAALVDITAAIAFGFHLDTLDAQGDAGTELHEVGRTISELFSALANRMLAPIPWHRVWPSEFDKRLLGKLESMKELTNNMVKDIEGNCGTDDHGNSGERRRGYALLLKSLLNDSTISREELYGNVMTFLVAGSETTANTISWALCHLAQHPHCHAAIREEAEEVLGTSALDADTLSSKWKTLPRTLAFIKESMRMTPVAPSLYLETTKGLTLAKRWVPAGVPVVVMTRAVQHDPSVFPNPYQFIPERWVQPSSAMNASFFPFGGGPRVCPGQALAMTEAAMMLSLIVRRFDVETVPEADYSEKFSFTVNPTSMLIRLSAC